MFGAWRANSTMCWPVPLPTSSTFPHLSFKNAARTDQIGRQLRWNAGASSRPSAVSAARVAKSLTNCAMLCEPLLQGRASNSIARDREAGGRDPISAPAEFSATIREQRVSDAGTRARPGDWSADRNARTGFQGRKHDARDSPMARLGDDPRVGPRDCGARSTSTHGLGVRRADDRLTRLGRRWLRGRRLSARGPEHRDHLDQYVRHLSLADLEGKGMTR